MSMTDHQTTDDIETDVESSRARVTDTLDEIKARLSPGQMMDEVLSFAKQSGGGDFANNLGRAVRDNPMPVLLIGAGIAMMAMSRNGSASGTLSSGMAQAGHSSSGSSSTPSGLADRAGELGSKAYGSANATAHDMRDAAASAVDSGRRMASSVADSVSHSADQASDAARRTFQNGADQAAAIGTSLSQGLNRLMEEQPLLLGALGLAVGAALGSALPRTDAEDRMMGETAGKVKAAVKDTAEIGVRQAREMMDDATASVGEALDPAAAPSSDKRTGGAGQDAEPGSPYAAGTSSYRPAAPEVATGVRQDAGAVPTRF